MFVPDISIVIGEMILPVLRKISCVHLAHTVDVQPFGHIDINDSSQAIKAHIEPLVLPGSKRDAKRRKNEK